jgi:transposase
MAQHGMGTYRALQKKYIHPKSVEKRGIWGFERRYWKENDFKQYRYSDESHFACSLQ